MENSEISLMADLGMGGLIIYLGGYRNHGGHRNFDDFQKFD